MDEDFDIIMKKKLNAMTQSQFDQYLKDIEELTSQIYNIQTMAKLAGVDKMDFDEICEKSWVSVMMNEDFDE